ncbi:undecaprenyl-diphosphatase [Paenibacillus alginolyticus]|uniref:Undecaprenyl-diphosphatase n=1 Tax=Paenibacillus alginolyticus TaxID=59839 RepID=A0ABT4G5L7_9BACL|nr:undecaprenyl-diphosphatase [Paenibacillus alginolyticus]MCY9691472.1 undecaprenyl-diphosphatase [Paenibacillus alginolyticus]MEC0146580.1 undecaprenyl-diphosphatase [Paenibacillus alginolyticus]
MSISYLDYQVFQFINHLALTYPIINPLMRFLAQDAEYLVYLGIIVYWFTRAQNNRQMVAEALLSACAALGGGGIISHFFYRDRPFVHHSVIQLIQHPANASFPSDHATGAFVIATAFWMFRKKDGIVWLILAACIALSRIWSGVHYPLDVIVGAMIGMTSAILVHRLFIKSAIAQKCLEACMDVYEKVEKKLWVSILRIIKYKNKEGDVQ